MVAIDLYRMCVALTLIYFTRKQQQEESVKEVKAYMAREQMKARAVKKDPPPERSTTSFGPAPRAVKPYGSWTPVVTQ